MVSTIESSKTPPSYFRQVSEFYFYFLSKWYFANQKSAVCANLTQLCCVFYLSISLSLSCHIES